MLRSLLASRSGSRVHSTAAATYHLSLLQWSALCKPPTALQPLITRCATCAFHSSAASSSSSSSSNSKGDANSYLRPQQQRQQQQQSNSLPYRERQTDSSSSASSRDLTSLSPSELKKHQDDEHDRLTRKAARQAKQRRQRSDRRRRGSGSYSAIPQHPLPPLYHPSPFADLPVIPSATETLDSAMSRVDKVPKSPGFGKEISRVRGQMFKYNFIARRQLETALLELATKLKERVEMFPKVKKVKQKSESSNPANDNESNDTNSSSNALVPTTVSYHLSTIDSTLPARRTNKKKKDSSSSSTDRTDVELHPFDERLLECTVEGGSKRYESLLNHTNNLIQHLHSAYHRGMSGLNHSKSIAESREVHKTAIYAMKDLWKEGKGASEETGGAQIQSGMRLVEDLRHVSKVLRHIPEIKFRRNLLDVRDDVASYLSLLPQEMFLLEEQELTYERLRPYLPPSPTYSVVLLGAPNVGKSSLLTALSAAKVDVQHFAFTTRGVQVGHLMREEEETPGWMHTEKKEGKRKTKELQLLQQQQQQPLFTPPVPLTRVQLIDTPGLLFRPDILRKPSELSAVAVCQHVNPLLALFVWDQTGTGGTDMKTQEYIHSELRQRFSTFTPPHPLASETDPLNRRDRDLMYANVVSDSLLQSLHTRLQSLPWIEVRTKTDLKKSEWLKQTWLKEGEDRNAKMLRRAVEEIRSGEGYEPTVATKEMEEEQDGEDLVETYEQEQREAEEENDREAEEEDGSTSSALVATTSTPRQRLTRAEWKLNRMRDHVRKYLCDPTTGRLLHDDLVPTAATTRGLSSSTISASTSSHSPLSPSLLTTALPVSTTTSTGLDELTARLWREVDARESLRLELAYQEMKARIIWMRGGQYQRLPDTGAQDSNHIQAKVQQQLS